MFYVLLFLHSKAYFFLVILYSPYNSSTRFTFYVLCFVSFVTLFSVSIQQGLCFMFYLLFTTFMLPMLTSNLSTWFSFYTLANPYGNTTRTKFMFYVLPFNIWDSSLVYCTLSFNFSCTYPSIIKQGLCFMFCVNISGIHYINFVVDIII